MLMSVMIFVHFDPDEHSTRLFKRNDTGTDDKIYLKLYDEYITTDGEVFNAVEFVSGELVKIADDETVVPIILHVQSVKVSD